MLCCCNNPTKHFSILPACYSLVTANPKYFTLHFGLIHFLWCSAVNSSTSFYLHLQFKPISWVLAAFIPQVFHQHWNCILFNTSLLRIWSMVGPLLCNTLWIRWRIILLACCQYGRDIGNRVLFPIELMWETTALTPYGDASPASICLFRGFLTFPGPGPGFVGV